MAVRELAERPSVWRLYGQILAGALPGRRGGRTVAAESPAPPGGLRLRGIAADPGNLDAYRRVCGFARGAQALPPTYPQVLAFPLHLALMTDPAFPFSALGLVHVANTVEQLRPIPARASLDLDVRAGEPRPHPRGVQVAVHTEVSVAGEVAWRGEAVMLSRSTVVADAAPPAEDPVAGLVPAEAPTGPQTWRLPGDLGRRYGAVSGDRNPIHLCDLTAKPFGFSRHIAHGMWTKARCLAELGNRLPDAHTARVAFRKPVALPGTVRFGARVEDGVLDFAVTAPSTGSPHLLGRVSARG